MRQSSLCLCSLLACIVSVLAPCTNGHAQANPPSAPSLAAELATRGTRAALRVDWRRPFQAVTEAESPLGTEAAFTDESFRRPEIDQSLIAKTDLGSWVSCAGLAAGSQRQRYDFGEGFGVGQAGETGALRLLSAELGCGLFVATPGGRLGLFGSGEATLLNQQANYVSQVDPNNQPVNRAQRDESGLALSGSIGLAYQNDSVGAGGYLLFRGSQRAELTGNTKITIINADPPVAGSFASSQSRSIRPQEWELGLFGQASPALSLGARASVSLWNREQPSQWTPDNSVQLPQDPLALAQPNRPVYRLGVTADQQITPRLSLGLGLGLASDASQGLSDALVYPDSAEALIAARSRIGLAEGLSLTLDAAAARSLAKKQALDQARLGFGAQQRFSFAAGLAWGY